MISAANPHFFTGPRRATFLAIAERVVPGEGPQAPGADSQATLEAAESFLASQDETTRSKLRLLLTVFEWRAVLKFGRRFTRLAVKSQDAYLHAWENSRFQLFRFGFTSLRNLSLLSFYTRPESWALIGYRGPVLETRTTKP